MLKHLAWIFFFLLCLLLMLVVVQFHGPTGEVPEVHPRKERLARPPPVANAADDYIRAAALLGDSWDPNIAKRSIPSEKPLPHKIVTFLERRRDVVEALESIRATECALAPGDGPDGWVDTTPSSQQFRVFSRILTFQARAAAEKRNVTEFARATSALRRMVRHLEQQEQVIPTLMGMGADASYVYWVLLPFDWPELSDAERVAHAERILKDRPEERSMVNALRRERTDSLRFGVKLMVEKGLPAKLLDQRVAGEFDRVHNVVVRFASLPIEEQVRRLRRDRGIAGYPDVYHGPLAIILNVPRTIATIVVADMTEFISLHICGIARRRGTHAAAAVWRHRLTTGRFPEVLADAGADAFVDPFSAAPFVYRVTDDGFILYSVGFDGDDDGGKHEERLGKPRPPSRELSDGDYVFWPRQ